MDTQTIVKTPPHYTSSTQNNSTFQDLSFSSYLKPKDPTPNSQETDKEICIFDAHKYFNETNDPKDIKRQQTSHDSLSVPRLSTVSSVGGYRKNFWKKSLHGTPKSSSEVSWNSQTGLLSNPLRNLSSNKRISCVKKWFFGRKCCCSGKKSVQVKEINSNSEQRKPVVLINNEKINGSNKANCLHTNGDHIMEIHKNKVGLLPHDISTRYHSSQCRISASGRPFIDGPIGFTFPILSPSSDKGIIAKPIVNLLEDPSMDNPIAKPICKPLKDPSMDNPVNLGSPFNPGSPMARDDDMGSDASSDLFEIESFSNHTTLYRRGESLDEEPACNANGINNDNIHSGERSLDEPPPSVSATECFPSSEVISGSEIGEVDFLIRQRAKEAGDDAGKRKPGDNTVVLMSCRQEKAVGLGPHPVKCVAEGPPMFPLHVGGRPPRAEKSPLGSASQSEATQFSLAFAA